MSCISPLSVDAQLLEALLTPELTLSVGRELAVRFASTGEQGRGLISLAAQLLEAEVKALSDPRSRRDR